MLATALLHLISLLLASTADGRQTPVLKYVSGDNKDYDAAVQFLWENDAQQLLMTNKASIAQWNYASNLTDENRKIMVR